MPRIFDSADSIFFVGGRGTKAGDANAGGGCTKYGWENVFAGTLSLVMGSNGEPLSSGIAWDGSGTSCTVTESGGGKVLITKVGAFAGFSGGCRIANVLFPAPWGSYSGRYEMTGLYKTADTIEIDLAYWGNDTTCCVKVGGAFDTLQNTIDNTDANATTPHNVDILTNKPKTYSGAGDQIDVDVGGGDITGDTWKRIISIDDNGEELAEGSYVTIDANGQACHVFNIQNIENIEFRHIYAKDADATHDGFKLTRTAGYVQNILLSDCKTTGCRYGVTAWTSYIRHIVLRGGYYKGNTYALYVYCAAFSATKTVFEGVSGQSINNVRAYYSSIFDGCVFKNTSVKALFLDSDYCTSYVKNCVFYNVAKAIELTLKARLVQYNNICIVDAKATGMFINRLNGSIDYSDYSCLWAMDGAPAAANRWGGTGLPENSIEADPQFVDAASGDFRPRNPAVLRGGRPDINGNPTQMGAILQKYQFGDRERIANMARLRIIR